MSKKNKLTIILSITLLVVLVLLIVAICIYSWYKTTALSAAFDIGIAISRRDADEVFDSIVSSEKKVLELFMSLLFLSEERALDLVFPEGSEEELKTVRLLDYSEEDDRATVDIKIIYKDKTEQPLTLTFIKEEGKWRLSIGKLIADLLADM